MHTLEGVAIDRMENSHNLEVLGAVACKRPVVKDDFATARWHR